jgi:hypothetical protein
MSDVNESLTPSQEILAFLKVLANAPDLSSMLYTLRTRINDVLPVGGEAELFNAADTLPSTDTRKATIPLVERFNGTTYFLCIRHSNPSGSFSDHDRLVMNLLSSFISRLLTLRARADRSNSN